MIQKRKSVASYLLLRDGIYYFQLRLKKNDIRRKTLKSGLIRKSLGTSNFNEAIHKARILWFEYNMNSNITDLNEKKAQKINDLYSRGKELHQIYNQLDGNDLNQEEAFFAYEFGTSGYSYEFDKEAFEYFSDFEIKNSYLNSKSTENDGFSKGSSQNLDYYIEKYIEERVNFLKKWKHASTQKFISELNFFSYCMNNCQINTLSIESIKTQYLYNLRKIPSQLSKIKELHDENGNLISIDEVVKYTEVHNLKRLQDNTVNYKITTIKVSCPA